MGLEFGGLSVVSSLQNMKVRHSAFGGAFLKGLEAGGCVGLSFSGVVGKGLGAEEQEEAG